MRDQDQHNLIPVDFDPFAEGELLRTVPATESQKEIWTAVQLGDDANCAFNESISLRFEGELDAPALIRALTLLVERHEALRTTFSPDGETLCVSPSGSVDVTSKDFSHKSAEQKRAGLNALLRTAAEKPFDLERGPLVRFGLIKLSESLWELIISTHHIICDGWSTAVLLKDLGLLYTQLKSSTGQPTLPDPTPFSAYADQLHGRDDSETCEFWVKKFQSDVPIIDWPVDQPRPPLRSFESARIDTRINPQLVSSLKGIAAKHRVSFFALLLACWEAYVSRVTGSEDVVTGIPAAGQSAAGLPDLVGHCVNLLPVRNRVAPDQSFAELLKQTQRSLLDAFEHQEYTFGSLLKQIPIGRDPSRVPVVPIQFNLDQSIRPNELGFTGLDVEFRSNPRAFENFEIFINLTESTEGLEIETQYNTSLFRIDSVRRRLDGFKTLLRAIADRPDLQIGEIPVVSPDERALVVDTWNQTTEPHDASATVHRLILRQAERTPESIAIECGSEQMSYQALDHASRVLADRLIEIGVMPGELVGLALERSIDMVVSALAIWRCGAAYVPLDPEFPQQRIGHMVADSGLVAIVTHQTLANSLPEVRYGLVLSDEGPSEGFKRPSNEADCEPGERAYVLYTSGSTGTPKGVEVPHRSVVNFLETMARNPGLAPDDRLVAVTTLSFDISVLELFLPLTVGARTIVATNEETRDGRALCERLQSSGANTMQATPATWRMLLEAEWRGGSGFTALCGGEAFPADFAKELIKRAGRVFNMYGPTETTIWSTLYQLKSEEAIIPIGRPIGNTQVYVLNKRLEPTGVGISGELYIGGEGVTLGYLGKPDLTRER
ncbi:condensation domain-containing protein, partial [Myxococcota bacterium]|nr:condensation domain-containing protein [Myxococcota bacterium]